MDAIAHPLSQQDGGPKAISTKGSDASCSSPAVLRESGRFRSNTWIPELLTLSLSMVSLAVIGVVVFVYDDHAVPTLPQGISLNAIVSVLATISKSALLFVVAACISQLKWPWYHVQRSLSDLQLLDDASRGPLGSIKLLCTRIIQSTASIGALVTVLALGLDPFLQQLIAYPIKEIYTDSDAASVVRATSFKMRSYDSPFLAAINAGIWSDPPIRAPTCPTGNCTWSEYTSMVWCSTCGDVTQDAVLRGCDIEALNAVIDSADTGEIPCRVELTDGGVINAPMAFTVKEGTVHELNTSMYTVAPVSRLPNPANVTSSMWDDPTDFGDYFNTRGNSIGIENPILAMGQASFNLRHGDSAYDVLPITLQSVQECVINICFADYAVSVSKGLPIVSTIRTSNAAQFQGKLPVLWPSYHIDLNTSYHCWQSPDLPESDPDLQSIYDYHYNDSLSEGAYCGLWVDTKGGAFCLVVGNQACTAYNWAQEISKRLTTNMPREYAWFSNGTINDGWWPADDVMQRFLDRGLENISSSIAASLSNLAFNEALVNQQPVTSTVDGELNIMHGRVGVSLTYVEARFTWMMLPALLELAAIGLLIKTIRSTKRRDAPLWKGSILALLSHGIKEDPTGFGSREDNVLTVAEIEKQAEKIRFCLRMTEKGYGFAQSMDVKQQSTASTLSSTSTTPQPPSR